MGTEDKCKSAATIFKRAWALRGKSKGAGVLKGNAKRAGAISKRAGCTEGKI